MAEPISDNPPVTDPQPADSNEWRQYIPEDAKEAKFWENVPDTPTLVKNYANAQKLIGASVRVPGDDATPEQVAAFYKKLGRPDDPKGYQIADIPGADRVPPETLDWYRQVAFENNLTQKAFNGVLSKEIKRTAKTNEEKELEIALEAERAAETLRGVDQWGANYERNLGYARRALIHDGSEELLKKIDKSGLGSDIEFMNLFYKAGRRMAEHGIIPGDVPGVINAEAARARIGELQARPEYMNPRLPGHKQLVDEVQKLYQIAYE